jgi:hypothetical protein
MAAPAYATPDLVAAAASELRTLRDLTGETSYLATLDGHDVNFTDRFDGAHSERLGRRARRSASRFHCTSQGKASWRRWSRRRATRCCGSWTEAIDAPHDLGPAPAAGRAEDHGGARWSTTTRKSCWAWLRRRPGGGRAGQGARADQHRRTGLAPHARAHRPARAGGGRCRPPHRRALRSGDP